MMECFLHSRHYLMGLSTFAQLGCDRAPQLYTKIHIGLRGWLSYYTKPFSDEPDCKCGLENKDGLKDGTLDTEDFPTVATDWDEIVGYARDQNLNFFTVPVGEAVKGKLSGDW